MRIAARIMLPVFVFCVSAFGAREKAFVQKTANLPLSFEENRGQASGEIRFIARQGAMAIFLRDRDVSIISHGRLLTKLTLLGSKKPLSVKGLMPTGGVSNYFIGRPQNWRTGIPNYSRVLYRDVYPGIDLIFHSTGGRLEYDFVLALGASPSRIQLKFSGPQPRLSSHGDLLVGEKVMFSRPALYQLENGSRHEIAGQFAVHGRRVSFSVAAYNKARELIIDPILNYSAIVGGSGVDYAAAVAVDSAGNAYVTGTTNSYSDFPVTPGAIRDPTNEGWAFVYKLNSSGTAFVYSALIGGAVGTTNSGSSGSAIAVDSSGNAFVAGATYALDFPITAGAFQGPPSSSSALHGFVLKLNSTGTALLYSTYLRSNYFDYLNGIAIDADGNAYICGKSATTFPVTSGAFQTTTNQGNAGFVAKLNATGTGLVYSTFLSGNSGPGWEDTVNAIAIDSSGAAYVTGSTTSLAFPTTAGAFQASASQFALGYGFVTKLSADGSSLVYSALLPGGGVSGNGIAVDNVGNAYVAGTATYLSFPNLLPTDPIGGLFASKLSSDGSTMEYTRVLGHLYTGDGSTTTASGLALDAAGNAWVAGTTTSSGYPVVSPIQPILGSGNQVTPSAVISEFDPTGNLLFSTYLGGQNNGDTPSGLAVDANGTAYVVGRAGSFNFPVTAGTPGKTSSDGNDTFIVSITNSNACSMALSALPSTFPASGGMGSINISTDSGCNWFDVSNSPWVTFPATTGGSGSGSASFSVAPNLTPARSTVISVAGSPVTISQASGCTYSLSAPSADVPAAGNSTLTVSLITGAGCPWTFTSPPSWTPLVSGGPDEGSNQFMFDVTANIGSAPRSATLTIAGLPFVINQAGGYSCTFSSARTGAEYGLFATLDTVPLTTTPTCSWSASSNAPWLHVTDVGSTTGDDPIFGIGSGFVNVSVDSNNSGAPRTGTITLGGLTFTAVQGGPAASIQAVFRDTSGSIRRLIYPLGNAPTAFGVFESDPAAAEDSSGNLFVVARDTYNALWLNRFVPDSVTWSGWQYGAGVFQGNPSVAVDTSGTAWVTARDQYNSYWINSYTTATGWGKWTPLYGIFSTDPVIAACPDGSVYLVGKDSYNSLWSGHYVPGSGFQNWQFGGGVIQGKPSITCGSDNAIYIVARDFYNSHWMARVSGNSWTGWYFGGALSSADPQIAELGGSLAVVILDPTDVVWRTTFTEGTGNGWQPWTSIGGILQDFSPAAVGGSLYLAGRTSSGDLWWWQQSGSQWTFIGNNGLAAGVLSAAPR